jgi:hypothetical protein
VAERGTQLRLTHSRVECDLRGCLLGSERKENGRITGCIYVDYGYIHTPVTSDVACKLRFSAVHRQGWGQSSCQWTAKNESRRSKAVGHDDMKSELDHSKSLTGTRARSTPPISWRIVFDEGFYSCFKDSSQPSLQHHPEFPVIYHHPGPPNLQEMVSWCSWLSHVSNTHKVPRSSLGEIIPFFFCLETLRANSGDVPIGSPHPRPTAMLGFQKVSSATEKSSARQATAA